LRKFGKKQDFFVLHFFWTKKYCWRASTDPGIGIIMSNHAVTQAKI